MFKDLKKHNRTYLFVPTNIGKLILKKLFTCKSGIYQLSLGIKPNVLSIQDEIFSKNFILNEIRYLCFNFLELNLDMFKNETKTQNELIQQRILNETGWFTCIYKLKCVHYKRIK